MSSTSHGGVVYLGGSSESRRTAKVDCAVELLHGQKLLAEAVHLLLELHLCLVGRRGRGGEGGRVGCEQRGGSEERAKKKGNDVRSQRDATECTPRDVRGPPE